LFQARELSTRIVHQRDDQQHDIDRVDAILPWTLHVNPAKLDERAGIMRRW
jgi:hypothetical protein